MNTQKNAFLELIEIAKTLKSQGPIDGVFIMDVENLDMVEFDPELIKTQASTTDPQTLFTITSVEEDRFVIYEPKIISIYFRPDKTCVSICTYRREENIKSPPSFFRYYVEENDPNKIYFDIGETDFEEEQYTQFAEEIVYNIVKSLKICLGNSELQSETRTETRLS